MADAAAGIQAPNGGTGNRARGKFINALCIHAYTYGGPKKLDHFMPLDVGISEVVKVY